MMIFVTIALKENVKTITLNVTRSVLCVLNMNAIKTFPSVLRTMLVTISNCEEAKQLLAFLETKYYVCARDDNRLDTVYEITERRKEEVEPEAEVIINQPTKEIQSMCAQLLNPFDASQVAPQAPMQQFPIGTHKVVIVGNEIKATSDNEGGYLDLTLRIIEGEFAGLEGHYRLNLYNKSEKAVEIAYKQLSAICHVTGVYQVTNADVLMNIPFLVIVGLQKKVKQDDPDYTEVKGVKDQFGNDPGKQGQPAQQQQQPVQQVQQQAVQQQQQAWGGQQQQVQQPVQQQPAAGGGWNQPQQQQQQPVQQQQFQQQQPVQQQNAWQQQGQQQQAANPPAWAQNK
jgi:hypothetical protein